MPLNQISYVKEIGLTEMHKSNQLLGEAANQLRSDYVYCTSYIS